MGNASIPNAYTVLFLSQNGRHGAGANYLLADGHVKYFVGDRVSSGTYCSGASTAQGAVCAAGVNGKLPDGSLPAITFNPA